MRQEHSTKQFWYGVSKRIATVGLASAMAFSAVSVALPKVAAAATGTSVADYGVRNDGTDSTSALQSLVNGGGKSLYFPAGTYRFAGVSVPANTTLNFDSGAKILPGYNGGNFLNINGSGVTVNGGSFDGQNTIAIAVMGNSVSGLTVNGTSATNMTNGNVNLVGCSNANIQKTSTTNSQYGIVLSGSSYSTINGTYAYGMGRDGILCYSSTHHITISNNYVEKWALLSQDGRAAIHTYGSSDFIVYGNTVKNGTYNAEGIRFRDSERFQCFDNTVDNIGGSGIAVVWLGDWQAVNGLVGGDGTIYNNKINNAHLRGISVPYTQLKPVRLLDNTITNTSSNFEPIDPADGIICYAAGSAIVGNTINGSTGNGIRTGGSNILVSDNSVSNVGTGGYGALSGILTQNSGASVLRNTISGVSHYGIYAMSTAYLEGNTITGAGYGATNLAGGTTGKLNGDTVAPSAWDDIKTSYNGGESFNLSASDSNSGLAAIRSTIDGGPVHTYGSSPVNLSVGTAGTHTITYWAVDEAGNVSTKQSRTYTVGTVVVPSPTPTPTPTPVPVPTTINAPTNLAGSAVDSNGATVVTLNWTDNASNEQGFTIERAYVHDGVTDAWVSIDTLGANANTYADRVLLGSTYKYRVRAYGSDGTSTIYSAYSNAAQVSSPSAASTTPAPAPAPTPTPTPTPAPTPTPTTTVPKAPSALSAWLISRTQAKLQWTDNSSNEVGFQIWAAGPSGVWSVYATVGPNTVSYVTPRLAYGTWTFKVCALGNAGSSPLSSAATVTVK